MLARSSCLSACLHLVLVFAPFSLTAEDTAFAVGKSEALATYSNTITMAELEEWRKFLGLDGSGSPDLEIQSLILVKSLADEAVRLGLDRRLETRLEMERERAALALSLIRREVAAETQVSDQDAEAWYQNNKDTFTLPRRVRLRNLFKRYPPDASAAHKVAVSKEIEALRQRALAGEEFAELAANHSDSQTRFQDGLIGNVSAGALDGEIDRIAMAMAPGEVSNVISGPRGLTLLYCESVLPAVVRSAEELRDIGRQRLRNRAIKRRWAALHENWLATAEIRYHWDVIETPEDDAAVAVEHADGTLSIVQLKALLSPRAIAVVPPVQVRNAVESYVVARSGYQEATRRGLLEVDDVAVRMLWSGRRLLATKTLTHLVAERFEAPTETETRSYYQQVAEEFMRPQQFDLDGIRLPVAGNRDLQESYSQGELLVHRLAKGDLAFEEAARLHSQHPTAVGGGRLGRLSDQELTRVYGPTFRKAVLRLQVGDTSDLVQEGDALWILRLRAVEAERPMTWEEAREAAENQLGSIKAAELEAQVREEWMQRLQVELSSAAEVSAVRPQG